MAKTPEEEAAEELAAMVEAVREAEEKALREQQQTPPLSGDASSWHPGDPPQ